ncbi:Bro-N domain-containing protein [Kitasatospora sp. NPDC094015]|uniref:BRO-N domain-containing protein n=1 Tax=Kitasatospora sp. NPDC094015 TaxID=3155205 RepID=UPI00331B48F3
MTNTNGTPAQFDFDGHEVRVVTIDGDPWWVARDVCAVLEIINPTRALDALDEDEKGLHSMKTLGGDQQVSVINEPGLYSLVLRSRKPQARAFKRWITHEVIPSIRRTGRYAVDEDQAPQVSPETMQFFRLVARAAAEAFGAEARVAARRAEAAVTAAVGANGRAIEGLDERISRLIETLEAGARPGVPPQRAAGPARPAPEGEPIRHQDIPEEALTFDALAELLALEIGRPGLSRHELFETACDAGLLRRLSAPHSGYSLTDRRLAVLFRVRRISGAAHGWPCVHHHQPLVLPQGVAIMRQLVLQDIGPGVFQA